MSERMLHGQGGPVQVRRARGRHCGQECRALGSKGLELRAESERDELRCPEWRNKPVTGGLGGWRQKCWRAGEGLAGPPLEVPLQGGWMQARKGSGTQPTARNWVLEVSSAPPWTPVQGTCCSLDGWPAHTQSAELGALVRRPVLSLTPSGLGHLLPEALAFILEYKGRFPQWLISTLPCCRLGCLNVLINYWLTLLIFKLYLPLAMAVCKNTQLL